MSSDDQNLTQSNSKDVIKPNNNQDLSSLYNQEIDDHSQTSTQNNSNNINEVSTFDPFEHVIDESMDTENLKNLDHDLENENIADPQKPSIESDAKSKKENDRLSTFADYFEDESEDNNSIEKQENVKNDPQTTQINTVEKSSLDARSVTDFINND